MAVVVDFINKTKYTWKGRQRQNINICTLMQVNCPKFQSSLKTKTSNPRLIKHKQCNYPPPLYAENLTVDRMRGCECGWESRLPVSTLLVPQSLVVTLSSSISTQDRNVACSKYRVLNRVWSVLCWLKDTTQYLWPSHEAEGRQSSNTEQQESANVKGYIYLGAVLFYYNQSWVQYLKTLK